MQDGEKYELQVNTRKLKVAGILSDFTNLLYPAVCVACGHVLVTQEKYICFSCILKLPRTNFHLDRDNPMEQLFWGRIEIQAAAALYYFEKGSKSRKILHHIKYLGNKQLAEYIGVLYGSELARTGHFSETDLIVPVPLHRSREIKRGYNQSEWFARGLAKGLGKKLCHDILVRYIGTDTQINKSRTERWENVENCFRVRNPARLENKHVLLVDDVVTTGATLESCAMAIVHNPGTRLSILTMAYA